MGSLIEPQGFEAVANRCHMLVDGVPIHLHGLGDLVDRLAIGERIADLLFDR
ncbi:MAG: hypothetical protein RLZZ396_700 [Planctomycetota bacterium]